MLYFFQLGDGFMAVYHMFVMLEIFLHVRNFYNEENMHGEGHSFLALFLSNFFSLILEVTEGRKKI